MDNVISFFWILMEFLSELLVCSSFLQKKQWNKFDFTILSLALLGMFWLANDYNGDVPILYLSIIAYYLIALYFYRGSLIRKAVAVVLCMILLSVLDTLIIYMLCACLKITFSELMTRKYTYMIVGTLSKGMSLAVTWLFYSIRPRNYRKVGGFQWTVLMLFFPVISLLMLVMVFQNFSTSGDLSVSAVGVTICIAIGNIGIVYLIYQLEKSERESQRMALLKQQMEIQTESILNLEKNYRIQQTVSHDFSHHINTIGTLLGTAQYDAAIDYVQKIQDRQATRVLSIHSHHPIVDAVLNQKYQLANSCGIDMNVKVNDLSHLSIPTDAVVVVLSNLLDNAIEASVLCSSEKEIRFSMILNENIFLSVDNTSNPVSFVDGKLPSTKIAQEGHGFGLENIKTILSDLGAEYAFRYHDGWFSFACEIPNIGNKY